MSTKVSRLIYIFLNNPTGSKPYVDKIYKSTPYLDKLYKDAKGEYLRKRDLERCGIIFPAGPRYLMLPYEFPIDLPEQFERYSPSGPDIIDIVHERYMKEQSDKRRKEPDIE